MMFWPFQFGKITTAIDCGTVQHYNIYLKNTDILHGKFAFFTSSVVSTDLTMATPHNGSVSSVLPWEWNIVNSKSRRSFSP